MLPQYIESKEDALTYLKNRTDDSDKVEFVTIDFKDTHFDFPVNFSKIKFRGNINFSNSVFDCDTTFDDAIFQEFACFDKVTFKSSVSFNRCFFNYGARFVFASFQDVSFFQSRFQQFAVFWQTIFNSDADFSQFVVDLPPNLPSSIDSQTNFSWAIFKGNARFSLGQFYTPVYFWRTIFTENVYLDQCTFDKEVVVGGKPTDVHFTKAKDIAPNALQKLKEHQLLTSDLERQFGENYQFNSIYSTEHLNTELDAIDSLTQKDKKIIVGEWENGHQSMFQEGKVVSFSGTKFNELRNCVFNYINLNNVYCDKSIKGTNEDKEYFVSTIKDKSHDFFISYAHELKDFAQELAQKLTEYGQIVWFDENDVNISDSLYDTIKRGLENSSYFIMILSSHYFRKKWTQEEFNLVRPYTNKIIQVWHDVTEDEVRKFSPDLADRVAFDMQNFNYNIGNLALQIVKSIYKRKV
ncbi:MAG: TIR domain-containing protein [Gammaproteobacteria bacterium]|jgi:hypothetical protein